MRTPTRCCCTHQHSNCNCICVAQVKATNNITFIPTIWCHGSAPGNTKLSFLFYFVPFESEISTPQWYLVALPLLDEQCWWMLYSARVFLYFFFVQHKISEVSHHEIIYSIHHDEWIICQKYIAKHITTHHVICHRFMCFLRSVHIDNSSVSGKKYSSTVIYVFPSLMCVATRLCNSQNNIHIIGHFALHTHTHTERHWMSNTHTPTASRTFSTQEYYVLCRLPYKPNIQKWIFKLYPCSSSLYNVIGKAMYWKYSPTQ